MYTHDTYSWKSCSLCILRIAPENPGMPVASNLGPALVGRGREWESGRGQPHKTWRHQECLGPRDSVLECGCPLPLSFYQTEVIDGFNLTPCGWWQVSYCFPSAAYQRLVNSRLG